MKNLIYACAVLVVMTACGTATKEPAEEVVEVPEVTQKYNYSGDLNMGDQSNYAVARQLNDAIVNEDMETASSLFADSVSLYLWDGTIFDVTRDSLMSIMEGYFGEVSNLEIIYHAGMAINSSNQGDDWGLNWATEQYNDADGKLMRINYQENYLIENGKIRSIRQYAQMVPEDAPAITANEGGEFSYSGSWVDGDDNLREVVLGWNNSLATPTDLETSATYLADSVTVVMWDGTIVDGLKDSVMVFVKEFVTGASSVKVDFDAIMVVHSTDMNSDVVMSWTEERWTDKEGKEEHMWIHEDYVLENGKIRMVQQYAMKDAKSIE